MNQLQVRAKWYKPANADISIGTMVLIKETNVPRLCRTNMILLFIILCIKVGGLFLIIPLF